MLYLIIYIVIGIIITIILNEVMKRYDEKSLVGYMVSYTKHIGITHKRNIIWIYLAIIGAVIVMVLAAPIYIIGSIIKALIEEIKH